MEVPRYDWERCAEWEMGLMLIFFLGNFFYCSSAAAITLAVYVYISFLFLALLTLWIGDRLRS